MFLIHLVFGMFPIHLVFEFHKDPFYMNGCATAGVAICRLCVLCVHARVLFQSPKRALKKERFPDHDSLSCVHMAMKDVSWVGLFSVSRLVTQLSASGGSSAASGVCKRQGWTDWTGLTGWTDWTDWIGCGWTH